MNQKTDVDMNDPHDHPPAPLQVQVLGEPRLQVRLLQGHLQEPQEKEEHKWEVQRKEEWKNVEAYRVRSTADKAQIFQILGYYAVFQGVVVNTVCTSAKLNCQTSYLLVALSALLSVGTLFSVFYKFSDYMKNNKKLLRSEMFLEVLKAKILPTNEQAHEKAKSDIKERYDKKIKKDECQRRKFKWAVLLFLVLFSIIILLCCIIVRCVE